jgi:NADH:ubiquinone oxidoreductase subunit H
MAEYANMITVAAVATTDLLGGWHPLFPERFGSNFVPTLLPGIFRRGGPLPRPPSGAPAATAIQPARFRAWCSSGWQPLFLIPAVQSNFADSAVLVRRQDRLAVVSFRSGCAGRCRASVTINSCAFAWKAGCFPVAVANLLVTGLLDGPVWPGRRWT